MPVMDGIELAHQAAAAFPGLKILLMTGYAEQRERADDLAEKIIDVVAKPFALAGYPQGGGPRRLSREPGCSKGVDFGRRSCSMVLD